MTQKTKIIPLVLSKDDWHRFERWRDHGKEDADTLRRREQLQYLDEMSREMTKSWPNSLENVNKRNEELRRARIEVTEQANSRFYKRYLKRKDAEQKRLMYSARDTIFKNKDAPKLLLSAVIDTFVQKERNEQLKFQAELKRIRTEKERQDDNNIIQGAKAWHLLMAGKRKLRFDINKRHQRDILDQANEIATRNQKEYEEELNRQKIDNLKATEEIRVLKEFEDNYKSEEKARIAADMNRASRENAARRAEVAARDSMDDQLINVLLRSQNRVDMLRKKTEKDITDKKLRVLENISRRLESGDTAREQKEQDILNKAVSEKDAADEARRQSDIRKRENFRKQRVLQREQWLQDEQQRIHEHSTMRQWDIMNRFKNAELNEAFEENLRKEKERKIKEHREDILKLWKERTDREEKERAETRYFYGELAEQKLRDADNKLLTHAAALIEEAKAQGRPPHALHKAIDHYCKLNRLYPMPPLPRSMQQHMEPYAPRDTSAPDPGYSPPPRPAPVPDMMDEVDDDEVLDDDKRDGLQVANTQQTAAAASSRSEKKEETVQDYKRVGRANGLQRRKHDIYIALPKIDVCQTLDCRCDFKPK